MHGWFHPIHLIGRKCLHFDKTRSSRSFLTVQLGSLEFFLNGTELPLNSGILANSGNLINHWSMNLSQMCPAEAVVSSWSFTQEVVGSNPCDNKYFLSLSLLNSVETFRKSSIVIHNIQLWRQLSWKNGLSSCTAHSIRFEHLKNNWYWICGHRKSQQTGLISGMNDSMIKFMSLSQPLSRSIWIRTNFCTHWNLLFRSICSEYR